MRSTKLLTILFLVFISASIFAQKVHYKDSYYTIVKSKIFHRGHDVFGRLTAGEKDTIHLIAKELYDKKGKLKEQYKTKKKRDRYKLPANFWELKEGVIAKAITSENDPNKAIAEINTTEEKQLESTEQKTEKAVVNQPIGIEESQKEENEKGDEEDKTKENTTAEKKPEKIEETKEAKEKPLKETSEKAIKEDSIQSKGTNKSEGDKKEKQERVEEEVEKQQKSQKEQQEVNTLAKEKNKTERERKEKEKRAKEQEKEAKHQKSKYEKSVDKENRTNKKSTEKIEKKQSKEAKKLKEKKKSLEKVEIAQLKTQKLLDAKAAALISASAVSSAVSNQDTFGTIYMKINKEKTYTNKNGTILLFFDVINNSNKDLVILKPNNSIDSRLDFFSNTMECEDIPITSTDYTAKDLKIKDEDYLTIPANAKIELFVNGKYRNWLACNSEDIILQIQYNPFKNAEQGDELEPDMKKELSKSLKKISPIKIESENIKFKLNKLE